LPLGVFVPARLNDLAVDVNVGTPARGAIFYRGASVWNALAAGTSGQVLTSGGAGADPSWATPASGVTDHGLLTGLGDDDHAQYALLTPTTSARNTIQPSGAAIKPLVVKGFASQTADLLDFQSSAAATLSRITASGSFSFGTANADALVCGVYMQTGVSFPILIRSAAGVNQFYVNSIGTIFTAGSLEFGSTSPVVQFGSLSGELRARYYEDTNNTKGYWDTGQTGINWTNFNRVIGNVNVAIQAATSQTADLQRWQNDGGRRLLAVPVAGDLKFYRDSSTSAERQAADMTVTWATNTDASRKARVDFNVWDTAARLGLRLEADGSNPMVGFLGAAASARVAITGSRGGNAALASLLTELASKGLITDSTTA
jgi:hypothetical protein